MGRRHAFLARADRDGDPGPLTARDAATTPACARGLSLIVNRAIPGGGWNYGNNVVFGRALRPQPGPTGIALLALAACGLRELAPCSPPALDYLRQTLPSTHAAASVGWGVLGLKAHDACPPEAASWLEEAYDPLHGHDRTRPSA